MLRNSSIRITSLVEFWNFFFWCVCVCFSFCLVFFLNKKCCKFLVLFLPLFWPLVSRTKIIFPNSPRPPKRTSHVPYTCTLARTCKVFRFASINHYVATYIYVLVWRLPFCAGRHKTTCVVNFNLAHRPRPTPDPRPKPHAFGGLEVGSRSAGAVLPYIHR